MLRGTVKLDLIHSAMVIGDDEPFGRNDLCCTTSIVQRPYHIFQAWIIQAVDILSFQFQSQLLLAPEKCEATFSENRLNLSSASAGSELKLQYEVLASGSVLNVVGASGRM